jgi:ABC-type multidrug transport system fused ATPase/permease subunit
MGDIRLSHVTFSYPTRPDVAVLTDVSLRVTRGTQVALVGHSGCGKSTVIQLIQRLYEVDSGKVVS